MLDNFIQNYFTAFQMPVIAEAPVHQHQKNDSYQGDILNVGDSAEFAAGMIYAYSGQTSDVRDYLVECSVHNDHLDKHLTRAFFYYSDGPKRDLHHANNAMKHST